MKHEEINCYICNTQTHFVRWSDFKRYHLNKVHEGNSPEAKEYYDKYYKKGSEGVCRCGELTRFNGFVEGYSRYCSPKCINENPNIKKLQKEIRKDYFKNLSEEKKESRSNNLKEKWKERDVDNMVKNIKSTKKERYGDENYNNIDEIKDKINNRTEEEKNNIILKQKNTIDKRTEKDWKDINKKLKATLLERYGDENYVNKEKMILGHKNRINNKIKKMNDDDILKNQNVIILSYLNGMFKCQCNICNKDFEISNSLYYMRNKYKINFCTNCYPIDQHSSQKEEFLYEFIKENYDGNIIRNDKSIATPQELDIYIPDLKLAFEFNGLYWHNELNRKETYHLDKTDACEEKGIRLVHIYEDDWKFKQDIVKSRILQLLNKTHIKMYAKDCVVKEIDYKISKLFLQDNHIQGEVISKINLGLYNENELVAVMTFGLNRINLGQKGEENKYELLRFCNKINVSVSGGASKLFKYFVNKYQPESIISYADRSWTMNNGNSLYNKLGFDFNKLTHPNYSYIVNGIRENRFKYRKDILIKEGYDPTKSEHEIMLDREIYRIYDSGSLKYVWSKA